MAENWDDVGVKAVFFYNTFVSYASLELDLKALIKTLT